MSLPCSGRDKTVSLIVDDTDARRRKMRHDHDP